jgi:hypothetical protein
MEREFALAYAEGVGYVHNIRSTMIYVVLVAVFAVVFVGMAIWGLQGMSREPHRPGDTYGQQSQ